MRTKPKRVRPPAPLPGADIKHVWDKPRTRERENTASLNLNELIKNERKGTVGESERRIRAWRANQRSLLQSSNSCHVFFCFLLWWAVVWFSVVWFPPRSAAGWAAEPERRRSQDPPSPRSFSVGRRQPGGGTAPGLWSYYVSRNGEQECRYVT